MWETHRQSPVLTNAGSTTVFASIVASEGGYHQFEESHEAALIGDTVGDPFRITAGASLVVLIGAVLYSKRSTELEIEPHASEPELSLR